MGEFDDMLKDAGDLIKKYPSSPLRLRRRADSGDYFFDKSDLKAPKSTTARSSMRPPRPVTTLARYKMGWIRINEGSTRTR